MIFALLSVASQLRIELQGTLAYVPLAGLRLVPSLTRNCTNLPSLGFSPCVPPAPLDGYFQVVDSKTEVISVVKVGPDLLGRVHFNLSYEPLLLPTQHQHKLSPQWLMLRDDSPKTYDVSELSRRVVYNNEKIQSLIGELGDRGCKCYLGNYRQSKRIICQNVCAIPIAPFQIKNASLTIRPRNFYQACQNPFYFEERCVSLIELGSDTKVGLLSIDFPWQLHVKERRLVVKKERYQPAIRLQHFTLDLFWGGRQFKIAGWVLAWLFSCWLVINLCKPKKEKQKSN